MLCSNERIIFAVLLVDAKGKGLMSAILAPQMSHLYRALGIFPRYSAHYMGHAEIVAPIRK